MGLFEDFENDFRSLQKDIQKACTLIPDLKGDEKDSKVKATLRQCDEARELLEQMDMEIIDLPSSKRNDAKKTLAGLQRESTDLEKRVRKAKVAMSGSGDARAELFDYDGGADDDKEKLLGNTARLDRTSDRLNDGHRVALEAVDVGAGIMENLATQRSTIERSMNRMQEANTPLAKANRVLGRMKQRAIANKAITAVIIFFLVITIIIVIILIVTGKK